MAVADIVVGAKNDALAAQLVSQTRVLRAVAVSLTNGATITAESAIMQVRKLSSLYAQLAEIWTGLTGIWTTPEDNKFKALGVEVDDLRIALADGLFPRTLVQVLSFGYTAGATREQKLAGISGNNALPPVAFAVTPAISSAATDVVTAIDALSLPA